MQDRRKLGTTMRLTTDADFSCSLAVAGIPTGEVPAGHCVVGDTLVLWQNCPDLVAKLLNQSASHVLSNQS